jgi:hypothetical protein
MIVARNCAARQRGGSGIRNERANAPNRGVQMPSIDHDIDANLKRLRHLQNRRSHEAQSLSCCRK